MTASAFHAESALAAGHAAFDAELSRITKVLEYEFRKLPPQRRSEAVADAITATWLSWVSMVQSGKDPVAVGPCAIATNSARYVRAGRRMGWGALGRGAMDVFRASEWLRAKLALLSLDNESRDGSDGRRESWRDWLVADRRTSPSDAAIFRVDFQEWLTRLPAKKRQAALLLADGESTSGAARLLGVTPARIAQHRAWLKQSWDDFQGAG
jgi:hypothetical protein